MSQVTTILNHLEEISTMCTIVNKILQTGLIPLSPQNIKTKKCQPDARDRPDLIQTKPVPSIGLARQHKNKLNEKIKNKKTNHRSHVKTNDLADSLPVANKLSVSRTPLSQELNSPVSLPVANKKTEDRHPDNKWLMDALIKTTKCQSAVRDILLSGHTLHTPRVTVVVPVSGQLLSGHTPHTPRVTVVVPVSSHILSGHTLHTPRVTVVVPVSSHNPHTPRVTVGVPGSRRSRKQNKNKQNEKLKNTKTNYRLHVKTDDHIPSPTSQTVLCAPSKSQPVCPGLGIYEPSESKPSGLG